MFHRPHPSPEKDKGAVAYDPEIEMFRGEFVGLSGGTDFYAADVASLKAEGKSLNEWAAEAIKEYAGRACPRPAAGRASPAEPAGSVFCPVNG